MKRSDPLARGGARLALTLSNFSPSQLAGIGSVAMTYNEAEAVLHEFVGLCLGYPGDSVEVTSRINGTEGLVALAVSAGKALGLLATDLKPTFAEHGFTYLKTLRDAICHSRMYSVSQGIGRFRAKRGKPFDVLLSVKALRWVTRQFEFLIDEMRELTEALRSRIAIRDAASIPDPRELQLEEWLQESLALCRRYREKRLALEPPPKFPEPHLRATSLNPPPDDWGG